jgi:hypothetical protein
MTNKKLRLIVWGLALMSVLSVRCHITITKNYYYSMNGQKIMRTETIIQMPDTKTGSKP